MQHFLDGVRVIQVLGNASPATQATSSDEDGTTTEVTSANGKVVIHKHSNGDEVLAIPIVAIVFTFLWLIAKAIMAPFNNRNREAAAAAGGGLSAEEVAILHKLERTLSQMESRVEALETILIDQSRTEKHYGSKL